MDLIAPAAVIVVLVLLLLIVVFLAVRIVQQYQQMVVFRLGRTNEAMVRQPGVRFLIPFVDRGVVVDLREQFIEVPSQTTITKDNAPINIDFLIYWRIADPLKSVVNVAYFAGALQGIATTTLRAVIGDITLDDVLSKRDQINEVLRAKLDEQTERWGGKITTVEIREITPPRDVQDAMNRQLSAERTRRAVITESEGARQANINVAEGEKQAAILRAEGQRQAAILNAEGFSQALERIFNAAKGVDAKTMSLQYLEALKAIGASPVHEVRGAPGADPDAGPVRRPAGARHGRQGVTRLGPVGRTRTDRDFRAKPDRPRQRAIIGPGHHQAPVTPRSGWPHASWSSTTTRTSNAC